MKLLMTLLFIAFTVKTLNAQQSDATVSLFYPQAFGGGAGTEQNPYRIYTKEHLEELADSVNLGYNWSKNMFFHLMNNIDDSVRTVIGLGPTPFRTEEIVCLLVRTTQKTTWNRLKRTFRKEASDSNLARTKTSKKYIDSSLAQSFQGYFNGRGHKITLAINMPKEDNVGLFGCISGDGLILDLDIDGYVVGRARVGGFVGFVRKELNTQSFYMFSECVSYATVTSTAGKDTEVGAIIGVAVGTKKNSIFIDRCRNNGLVNNKELFPDTICSLVGSLSKELNVKFRSIYE